MAQSNFGWLDDAQPKGEWTAATVGILDVAWRYRAPTERSGYDTANPARCAGLRDGAPLVLEVVLR